MRYTDIPILSKKFDIQKFFFNKEKCLNFDFELERIIFFELHILRYDCFSCLIANACVNIKGSKFLLFCILLSKHFMSIGTNFLSIIQSNYVLQKII